MAKSVDHRCHDFGDNSTEVSEDSLVTGHNVTYGECSIISVLGNTTQSRPCNSGYVYSEPSNRSVVSDMNLVCDRKALSGLSQTVLIGGQAFGALTLPHLSDRYGRKPILILSTVALMIIGIGTALAPNYPTFAVLRFIIGAFQQGIITTVSTLGLECFPSQHRKLVGFFMNFIWAICSMTIPLWAYFLQNYSWRILQTAYTSVSLYFIIQIWKVEESIPWLVANGKTKRVVHVLKTAAKVSKVPVHDVMEQLHLLEVEQKVKDQGSELGKGNQEGHLTEKDSFLLKNSMPSKEEDKVSDIDTDEEITAVKPYTILDLFKNKRFLMNASILWFMWFTNAMTYFGLFLTSSSLAGDRFLNFFLNAAVEVPAAFVYYFIVDRIGRKKSCVVFHGVTGVALITATIIKTTAEGLTADIFTTILSLIGKAGISGSFGLLFMYTSELFPTNLRNVGLGMCSAFARIGGMLAPFASLLAGYAFWAPGTIFGMCCLAVTVLVTFLPETTGRELPQTIEEMTAWYKSPDVNCNMTSKEDGTSATEMAVENDN
ncbi:organic cation transporter protein-like [Gigantopelta aegis]|uniref:organic cation transporter protein-like n=1 Tax=Gigantopelta aegis TaxID=1735272 RepID=UPI001B887FA1|nr:organic cation transporter protein-like [Gigantopelta aegis]